MKLDDCMAKLEKLDKDASLDMLYQWVKTGHITKGEFKQLLKKVLKEGSPSDFASPEVEFKKLDDLPNKGKGKPYTPDEIMQAMKVLHKMIHAQAKFYGGKDSKLLPAGIAEGSLLKSIANDETIEQLDENLDSELDHAYDACLKLQKRLGSDEESMGLLLRIIRHVNKALALSAKQ